MSLAVSLTDLTIEELERRLRQVEPAVVLVSPRILRRVIKHVLGLGGMGLHVPHRRSHIISRDELLRIVSPSELGRTGPDALPPLVILLPRPMASDLARTPAGQMLLRYWRLIFHARLHLGAMEQPLGPESVEQRIHALGTGAFAEARAVLVQENYLLESCSDQQVYVEMGTVFLELRAFDADRLACTFPAVDDVEEVEALFRRDLQAEGLLEQTRPEGADLPGRKVSETAPLPYSDEPPGGPDGGPPSRLRKRAEAAARRGNLVRAIILRLQAAERVPTSQAGGLRGPARAELERLVHRLGTALGLPANELGDWLDCLWLVAQRAARGVWNPEMRFLSDLQKICLNNERAVYSTDLVEWLLSACRRPLQRPLTDLPMVLTVKHLQRALGRLPLMRMPQERRVQLSTLVTQALGSAECRLRQVFRPRLAAALNKVNLTPDNAAEELERDRLVEEMLDDIVAHGYLTLGDQRDALARNRLKLPDIAGPVELVTGDPLLRVNQVLARDLDGVSRRGEIYLRGLQRLSSIFFGNPIGRWLTLYLVLPLVGSLFILKGIEGLVEEIHKFVVKPLLLLAETEAPSPFEKEMAEVARALSIDLSEEDTHKETLLPLFNAGSFVALALFLGLLLHVPWFRRKVVLGLWYAWLAVRGVLHDLPRAIFRLPFVRAVLGSRPYVLFYQFIGKPLLLASLLFFGLSLFPISRPIRVNLSVGFFALCSIVLNTRLGLMLEETAGDWMVRTWQLIREDLLPGLFRWIIWLSRRLQDRVEKIRYTVEEWLLFRQGQGALVFWVKLGLGVPWAILSYVSRFVIVVLLEPQVNPIKHFPVVTVSHKLMLIIAPPVASLFTENLGWPYDRTLGMIILVFSLIPGLFGFLAWELKENWKLYRANESPDLEAEMVGSHGEYIINYIRPGFHSGTLPKLFARMRRSNGATRRRQEEGLHHVEEEIRRFLDRDLLAPVEKSKGWGATPPLEVGHIHLATNAIRIDLLCEALPGNRARLEFQQVEGKLMARLREGDWIATLDPRPRSVLEAALTGLYCKAGVDYVVVSGEPQSVFTLQEHPIPWETWVTWWQADRTTTRAPGPLLAEVRLLPQGEASENRP
ncbi:MAG: hypothetical protein U0840_21065 [Gemmataceae bacterium]